MRRGIIQFNLVIISLYPSPFTSPPWLTFNPSPCESSDKEKAYYKEYQKKYE